MCQLKLNRLKTYRYFLTQFDYEVLIVGEQLCRRLPHCVWGTLVEGTDIGEILGAKRYNKQVKLTRDEVLACAEVLHNLDCVCDIDWYRNIAEFLRDNAASVEIQYVEPASKF